MTDPFVNGSFELAPTYGPDVVTASAAYVDDTVAYPIVAIGATKLNLKVDNGLEQILDFVGTETTAANIVATLNSLPIDGAIASVVGGQVRITSSTTGQYSFVEITGGTANLILQFPTTQARGNDGSFEGDSVANWTPTACTPTLEPGTRTGGIGEQVMRLTATGAADSKISEVDLIVGKTYWLSAWAKGDGTAIPAITFDATYDMYTGTASVDWDEVSIAFVAQSTSLELKGTNNAAGLYVEFDDIVVKQIFTAYGESSPWQWNSSQAVGGFAEFNSVEPMPSGTPRGYEEGTDFHLVPAYRAGREDFIADWDDNHLYYSSLPTPSAAEFNDNAPAFSGTVESFEVWDGANWIDGDPTFVSPYSETVPTGWNGWYNDDLSVNTLPLEIENFDESWYNDPFHSGHLWVGWAAGSAPNGLLTSSIISFPLSIGTSQADLYILLRSATDDLYKLSITPQTFTSSVTLVAHLNSLLPAALTNAGFEFAIADSSRSKITWGWDGSTDTATTVYETYFVTIQDNPYYRDSREYLGMDTLGLNSAQSEVLFPASLLTIKPAGVLAADTLVVDTWSQVKYSTDDPYGTLILSVYGQSAAIFNSAITSEDHIEQFLIDGWFGAAAAWNPSYSAPELSAASFTGAVTIEQFTNTDWPNELYP
jgi:hypothetical protein